MNITISKELDVKKTDKSEPLDTDYDALFDDARTTFVVNVLKAIAHPLRLRIAAILSAEPENVNGLARRLAVNQSIVSQQLRILRMSGLVEVERKGGFAIYSLAEPEIETLLQCMRSCSTRR